MEQARATADSTCDETQLVTFQLAGEEFGIPISFVKEIVRVPEVTRIPKAPPFIKGIANLRGSILPVVSLRERFGLPSDEQNDDNRVIVVEVGGRLIGIVVDQISEVMRITGDSVEPPPPIISGAVDTEYLRGVAKLKEGKRLVTLLDVERVVPSDEVTERATLGSGGAAASEVEFRANSQAADGEQMVSFRLAGEEYGVPIADVQEIIRVPEISRVPNAPPFVEGVVSLRNRLLPIVNLRKRLGLPSIDADDDSRIIVANLGDTVTGIQVDAVSEVLTVPRTSVEVPPEIINGAETQLLRGVAKLSDGKRLLMLIDIANIVSIADADRLAQMSAVAEDVSNTDNTDERQSLDEEQFVSFRLDDEEFGVGIHQVQEIIWLPEITKVPRVPYFVEGIVNLRGSVLPVIDIRKRFAMASVPRTDSTSIMVVDIEGRKTGVIVDSVSEVLRVSQAAIEPPPTVIAGIDAGFVRGVGKLENGQRMIIILDLAHVLATDRAA